MMRKNALAITVSTLVMGVFGAFLRWLQNRNIFEPETGLATPNAPISIVCLCYSALAFAGMLAIALIWLRRFRPADTQAGELNAFSPVPALLGWCAFAVFAAAGVLQMFPAASAAVSTASTAVSTARLQRIFGAVTVLAGACFPFLTSRKAGEYNPLGKLAASFLTLYYCFWLIYSYVSNAQDPVLWDYAPEIVALAGVTLGFYYLTGWYYNAGVLRRTVLFTQLGPFLCICDLPDSRPRSISLVMACTAAMLLVMEFVVLENMAEAPEKR